MNGRSIGEIIENLNPKSEVGGVKELEERLQKEENSLALVNEIPTEGFIRWAPIHHSALRGLVETTKLLIKFGADVNVLDDTNQSPLHKAAFGGSVEITLILLQSGADPKIIDFFGSTPEQKAIQYGHPDVAKAIQDFRPISNIKPAKRKGKQSFF